ncbi:MAG: hypothetical protein M9918_17045 [Anaerolineae bacterium]|nr:hypothetical protein [Anaerolineae bacterium]
MNENQASKQFEGRLSILRAALAAHNSGTVQLPDTEALAQFVTAQMNGEDVLQRYPEIAAQLDGSVEASHIYARLYDLMEAEAEEALPEPAAMPRPDLSFLPQAPTLLEKMQQAVEWAGDKLRIRFSAELLSFLQPPPALAPVRGSADGAQQGTALFTLTPQQMPDMPPITVTAFEDTDKPEFCLLEVVVEPTDREWPFDGIAVSALSADAAMIELTDVWGTATFTDVAVAHLGELTLEIDLTKGVEA